MKVSVTNVPGVGPLQRIQKEGRSHSTAPPGPKVCPSLASGPGTGSEGSAGEPGWMALLLLSGRPPERSESQDINQMGCKIVLSHSFVSCRNMSLVATPEPGETHRRAPVVGGKGGN